MKASDFARMIMDNPDMEICVANWDPNRDEFNNIETAEIGEIANGKIIICAE